jgi:hypothetical protein
MLFFNHQELLDKEFFMNKFKFDDLSKQAKIGYNALYNVVFPYAKCNGEVSFTVPLCLNSDNKVALTEKNFIFFESVLSELKLFGWYSIVENKGRAFDDVKGDFFTVSITVSNKKIEPPKDLVIKAFDFSEVDTSKLMKRNGKEEKAKTEANKTAEAEKAAEVEKTSKALEEKTAEVETLKKEVAKKEEQINKKAITISNCHNCSVKNFSILSFVLVLFVFIFIKFFVALFYNFLKLSNFSKCFCFLLSVKL